MNKIALATTNTRKMAEAVAGCTPYGIEVVQVLLDIEEIQSADFTKVALAKAIEAYRQANEPVAVTDTAWQIPALKGFPGAYMKEVAEWLTPQDFLNLIAPYSDRRICFIESIAYKDAETEKVFSREFWGELLTESRGAKGTSIETLAAFNGRTIAESHDQGVTSHNPNDYIWADFAKWYSTK